jgi:hypothetical protein
MLCACGCEQQTRLAPVTNAAKGWILGEPLRFIQGHAGRVSRVRHGQSGAGLTPEYRSWRHMHDRCLNANDQDYSNYGGRGISICQRWLDGFENFLADMGPRPSPKHSLDRIDNDGPYSPENCRWATQCEQMRNTRRTRLLTHDGLTLPLTDWAVRLGIHKASLRERLMRGWPIDLALSTPKE